MNRVLRGSVVLAAVVAALSCRGDPTDSLRNGVDRVNANPSLIYLIKDSSQNVVVEPKDEQGNAVAGTFRITNSGSPDLTVEEDTTYNQVYDGEKLTRPSPATRARFTVTAVSNTGDVSFTISVGGKSVTVPVRIVPTNFALATLSATAPAFGDTVALTAPAPFKFTPATKVSSGATAIVTVGISADSTQVLFLAGPNANAAVSADNAILDYAPGYTTFTLQSTAALTTPAAPALTTTFSNAAPDIGDSVTMSVVPTYRFLRNVTVTWGSTPGIIASIAADSQSLVVLPPPGATGAPSVGNVVLAVLTQVPLTLPATSSLTVSGTSIFAGKDDPLTAPTLPILAANTDTLEFYDNSIFVDQFYTLNAPAGSRFLVRVSWPQTGSNDPDVDLLACNAACSAFVGGFGGATAAQPENLTLGTFAAASTVHVWLNLYAGAAPPWVRIRIIRTN